MTRSGKNFTNQANSHTLFDQMFVLAYAKIRFSHGAVQILIEDFVVVFSEELKQCHPQ